MASERIYGRHPVLEALRADAEVRKIILAEGQKQSGIIREILEEAERRGVRIEWTARGTLDRLVEQGVNHQGIVAELPPFQYSSVEEILDRAERLGEAPFLLLLDGIQDVHNFGALLRTAEAAGMHGVIIPERRAVGVTPTVYKSSAGAIHHIPIAQVTNLTRTVKQLKERHVWFVGLDMAGEQVYHEANLSGALGVVLGAEGSGLSRLVAEICDFLVHIPMKGEVDSLNASVAGAILIYEALRQRG
ncbi:MAG: 23S rRNA (guanosine(2251)-2'-O)-methyltransferase RlmB [Chloroflexota bacterium]|nr:23S rRNA (guanosine(2251)-2'-O)-methyltransferase RlmB [Chloroflexota bacterium]